MILYTGFTYSFSTRRPYYVDNTIQVNVTFIKFNLAFILLHDIWVFRPFKQLRWNKSSTHNSPVGSKRDVFPGQMGLW